MTREQDTAKKIVEILDYGIDTMDAPTAGKLAAARQRAIETMAHAHVAHAESALAGGRGAHMHAPHGWLPWAAAVAAALLLFMTMQQHFSQPVDADALLLASDLPPEAYVDKGFDAWLENSSRH